ncbi:hypothetical protein DFH09DRAFT_1090110 [Mycena vulgaris]|nr:hypothetical protein DFH09DRAFT_1090110 [Mycena vulgaris]
MTSSVKSTHLIARLVMIKDQAAASGTATKGIIGGDRCHFTSFGGQQEDVGRSKRRDLEISRIFGGKFRSTLRAAGQKDSAIIEAWRTLRLDIQFINLCDEDLFDESTAKDISDTDFDSDLHRIITMTKESELCVPAIPSRTMAPSTRDITYSIVEGLVSLPSNIEVLRLEAHDYVPPLSLEKQQHQTLEQLGRLCPPCVRYSMGPRLAIGREWVICGHVTHYTATGRDRKQNLMDQGAFRIIKLSKCMVFGPELEIGGDVLAPTATTSGRKPVRYKLFAAVYHGVSAAGGHYTLLDVLHAARGWARNDDKLVSDVCAEDVFGVEREREKGRCACGNGMASLISIAELFCVVAGRFCSQCALSLRLALRGVTAPGNKRPRCSESLPSRCPTTLRNAMFSRERKVAISGGTSTINSQVGDPTPSAEYLDAGVGRVGCRSVSRMGKDSRYVARLEARLEEVEESLDVRNLYVTYAEIRWTTVGAGAGIPTKVSAVIFYKLVVAQEHTEEGRETRDGCESCGAQYPCGFSPLPQNMSPTTAHQL